MVTKDTHYVYFLLDPRDQIVRYIGKSIYPQIRFDQHIKSAKNGWKYPVYRWIRKLLKLNLRPILEIKEQCCDQTVDSREKFWIAEYKKLKIKLTNVAEGGTGGATRRGVKYSKEHCEAISNGLKGKKYNLTEEQRAALRERPRGRIPHNKLNLDLDYIRKRYVDDRIDCRVIAQELNTGYHNVYVRLKKMGLR